MTKPDRNLGRELPKNCVWASSSRLEESKAMMWSDSRIAAGLKTRVERLLMSFSSGLFPAKEHAYAENGIWIVKITKPSPGYRLWAYRVGNSLVFTHVSKGTSKPDHKDQLRIALDIKASNTANPERVVPASYQPAPSGRRRKKQR